MSRLPTLFVPHGGGPCFFMEWNPPNTWDRIAAYLRQIPEDVGARPKAIVLISGHWEEEVVTIQNNAFPPLLYDYYGFPPHTYEIKFPAAGAPGLSARIAALLGEAGIDWKYDHSRGFDHGVFIPLKVAFPNADVPIVQVSLLASLDAKDHIRLGLALAPLRDEGVLIIGSGMTYHNLRAFSRRMAPVAEAFDAWLREAATAEPAERDRLLGAWTQAPMAREAHPREEHLLPLMVIAGAAGTDRGVVAYNGTFGGLRLSAYHYG